MNGYRSGGTIRTGRTVQLSEPTRAGRTCNSCIVLCLLAAFLVVVPFLLFAAEVEFRDRVLAFNEAGSEGLLECKSSASDAMGSSLHTLHQCAAHPGPVHIASDQVAGTVGDAAFGVELDNALQLDRHTEYCQWSEHAHDTCDQCSRTKKDSQGRTVQETYRCNCRRMHTYYKSWRPYRINSLLFDQPAAHHNPQRDPYPSTSIVSADARIGDVDLDVSILNNQHAKLRANSRSVNWTPTATRQPGFFDGFWAWLEISVLPESFCSWFTDTTRYESLDKLAAARHTEAASKHRFVYVGQNQGYFFSPYTAAAHEALFKMFFQHLEGSLLDWQLGDLMPSCTAGDIRVSFRTKDPQMLSAVGKLIDGRRRHTLTLHTTSRGYPLGLAHAGFAEWEDMFEVEAAEAKVMGRGHGARVGIGESVTREKVVGEDKRRR